MPQEFKRFIDEITAAQNLDVAYSIIDRYCENYPEFKTLDLNLFQYGDYIIKTGKTFHLKNYCENLKKIKDLQLSCAPELIFDKVLKNNEDIVIITKISDSSNGDFSNYSFVKNSIPLDSKKKLIEDFDKLAKKGLYNPLIAQSIQNWLVIPTGKSIYIDDWHSLKTFSNDEEKNIIRKELLEMCNILY